jgi:hypothetical protein
MPSFSDSGAGMDCFSSSGRAIQVRDAFASCFSADCQYFHGTGDRRRAAHPAFARHGSQARGPDSPPGFRARSLFIGDVLVAKRTLGRPRRG